MSDNTPLTPEEERVMEKIVEAHNLFTRLPLSHFTEPERWEKAVHELQTILFQRRLKREHPEYFR